jgi:26S proteasome regulatory subunit N4
MLAQPIRRQSSHFDQQHHHLQQPSSTYIASPSHISSQNWISSYSTPITSAHSDYSLGSCSSTYLQTTNANSDTSYSYSAPPNSNDLHIQVDEFESSQEPELMHSDHTTAPASWNFMNGQLTPTSVRTHYRESSLSSVGSTGPASPYNSSTPHSHVVLSADHDSNYDGLPLIDHASYHNFSKPLTPSHTPLQETFLAPSFQQSYNLHPYNSNPHVAAFLAMQRQQTTGDEDTMVAPEYSHSGRPSVASTHDSPATPPVVGEYEERKIGEPLLHMDEWLYEYLPSDLTDFRHITTIPKLDRTMSDVYNDELYNPSFTFTSAPSTKVEPATTSHPSSAVFSQMLQVANNQHLSAPRSPIGDQSRDEKIAFREGSPLAPVSNNFGSPQARFGSAQLMRERQKAENDSRVLQQQIQRTSPIEAPPKTISPRDALLDYHETDEDSAMPLFPPQKSPQYRPQASGVQDQVQPDFEDTASQQSFGSMATSRRESSSAYSTSSQTTQQPGSNFTFAPPSVPGNVRIPQQYPFVPQQRRRPSNMSNITDISPDFPSTLSSMESSNSEYVPNTSDLKKPAGSNADGGTYTCTYHGCTLRFETPAKLQKHKREGHRQSAPLIGSASVSATRDSEHTGSGMTSAALLRNSQAGPHRCDRINPSTGKPCNTIFSRPYDLTRHEDTIHNARKMKVRCPLCKEDKTFSRSDALTRHYRVVHPDHVIPGRKRHSHE